MRPARSTSSVHRGPRIRAAVTTAAEIAGIVFITVGIACMFVPAALIFAGLALVFLGWVNGR